MRGTDGYILVAVLGMMLVLAGLIASTSLVAQSVLRSARADQGGAGLDGLARGGLEVAAFELFSLHVPFAVVNGRPLRFAGGSTTATFTDEAARIDVNATDPAVLLGALRSAGLGDDAASATVSRVIMARQTGGAAGEAPMAPDAVAAPKGTPPAAAQTIASLHGSFRSVADFVAFAGVRSEEAEALQSLLTTSNPDGKVDALTASRRVLMSLPNMSAALADSILDERRAGLAAVARLKGALGSQAAYVKFEPGPCYGVTVQARDAVGRSATRHGIISASRSPGVPFYTLLWE